MHSKRKIPDSWRTGWKAKACTSFALYLKVFKNHLYYLGHGSVLSVKPCLHTQLPEHNKNYWKVSRGRGHLITWNEPIIGDLNSFSASGGGNLNKNFPKLQMPAGLPGGGGKFKLRFDWYITVWFRKTGSGSLVLGLRPCPHSSVFKRQRSCSAPFSKRFASTLMFSYRFRPSRLQRRIRFGNAVIPSVRMLIWTRRMRISIYRPAKIGAK